VIFLGFCRGYRIVRSKRTRSSHPLSPYFPFRLPRSDTLINLVGMQLLIAATSSWLNRIFPDFRLSIFWTHPLEPNFTIWASLDRIILQLLVYSVFNTISHALIYSLGGHSRSTKSNIRTGPNSSDPCDPQETVKALSKKAQSIFRGKPLAPSSPHLHSKTHNTLTLTWYPVDHVFKCGINTLDKIIEYELYYRKSDSSIWSTAVVSHVCESKLDVSQKDPDNEEK